MKVQWLESYEVDVPGQGRIGYGDVFTIPDEEARAREELGQVKIVVKDGEK